MRLFIFIFITLAWADTLPAQGVFTPAATANFAGKQQNVRDFARESGATNLDGLDQLVRYIFYQGLWDDTIIYPMKSSQNAGSGATVYGIGGLHSTNITLVNSPTWGATGITFNGTNQHGQALNTGVTYDVANELSVFSRFSFTTEKNTDTFDTSNPRNIFNWLNGNDITDATCISRVLGGKPDLVYRNASDTTFITSRSDSHDIDTGDQTVVWQIDSTNLRNFINKTETSYSNQDATVSSVSSGDDWYIGAQSGNTRYADAEISSLIVIASPLTATQRETITDIINDKL